MILKDTDVIKDLRLLADLIEEGAVQVEGFGVRKKFEEQSPEFADFDGDTEATLKDTGKRVLNLEFIE